MLKQRLLTAGVLIPLFVWGVLALPSTYFAALLAAVVVIAAAEWGRLVGLPNGMQVGFVVTMALLLLLATIAPPPPMLAHGIAFAAVIWWIIALQWLRRYEAGEEIRRERWSGALVGVLVLVPAWAALTALHRDSGPGYVLFLFILIWAADTGAYFCGRRFGRRKLAPRVSPGKTWEGVTGGVAAALLVAVIGAGALDMSFPSGVAFVILCGIVVAVSVVGDLVESLFKRVAGVKDSGHFLPGHGGALDRIDSITSAAPVFYLGVGLIGRFA